MLAASLVASLIVRERFGYSFSTWRLHLRGETIKSARDVGWMRTLTAGQMMRRETAETLSDTTIADFPETLSARRDEPVGWTDTDGTYAGIVATALAYGEGVDLNAAISTLAPATDLSLSVGSNVSVVMATFDRTQSDQLAVIDRERRVLGVVTEAFVRRRYAEELEKAQRNIFGER